VEEIEITDASSAVALRDMKNRRKEHFASVKLQSKMMQHCSTKRFARFKRGLILLQAEVRMQNTRRKFMRQLSNSHRPIRLRVCEYKNIRPVDSDCAKGMGNPMCMLTV
jgi:hypothetical protein